MGSVACTVDANISTLIYKDKFIHALFTDPELGVRRRRIIALRQFMPWNVQYQRLTLFGKCNPDHWTLCIAVEITEKLA